MNRLTKEEIEQIRAANFIEVNGKRAIVNPYIPQLCDLALQSIDGTSGGYLKGFAAGRADAQESVRSEALEEAAKACELTAETCFEERRRFNLSLRDRVLGYIELYHQQSQGYAKREQLQTMARIIRTLSPARVAEGEPVREALSNLVSLLLQTMKPIGPMRDRKDYPPELQTAINVLRAAPESPAQGERP